MNRFALFIAAAFCALVAQTQPAHSAPLKIMTFNTMCDFCKDHRSYGPWKDRFEAIADTIRRYDPDLISLQEMRTRAQVNRLNRRLLNQYTVIFAKGLLSYTDATLLVRKSRFNVLKTDGGFLGPRWPRFSFGWQTRMPRRLQIADLEDKMDGLKFRFAGTHFDNAGSNKEPSARFVVDRFSKSELPVIFAGDTNSNPSSPGYAILKTFFRDAFEESAAPNFVANGPYDIRQGCHYFDRDFFPECRIDHVMLSPNAPWRGRSFSVDVYRYGIKNAFVSDHRAIVVELE